jgi:glycosyltransferase involved in cell wall biosynthesis
MMEVYDWVLRRGPRPACVRTDLHSEVGRSILRGAAQPAADAAGSAGESPTRAAAERPVVGVAHVVSELPEAAGTTVFCVELCTGIAAAGHRVGMAIGRWTDDPDYPLNYAGVRLVWPRRLNWQGRPLPFVRRVGSAIRELSDGIRAELVHVHALWEAVPHAGVGFARAAGLPLVFSPHGMSTPWALAHHWWRKRAAWLAYQRRDLLAATVLHATAHAEAEDLRRLGFEQPIAVVPLGVHLPRPEGGFRRSGVGRQRTILFLSRIHPKKGLFNLVDAWAAVRQPGWRVVIAGPDEADHRAEVEKRAVRCGVADDFHFVGPVFGDDKDGHYRDAELFVLPSYRENFGVVVADALAYGVPAITTRATPWREVQEHRCGWWIETGVAPLAEALRAAMACTPQERAAMGERGRALVEERYAWPSVVAQMVSVYEWILHRGGMPACMRME